MRAKKLVSSIPISFLVQLLGLTSSRFRYLPRRSPFALGRGREYLFALDREGRGDIFTGERGCLSVLQYGWRVSGFCSRGKLAIS